MEVGSCMCVLETQHTSILKVTRVQVRPACFPISSTNQDLLLLKSLKIYHKNSGCVQSKAYDKIQ